MVYASTSELVRENVDKDEKQVMIDYGLKVMQNMKAFVCFDQCR